MPNELKQELGLKGSTMSGPAAFAVEYKIKKKSESSY